MMTNPTTVYSCSFCGKHAGQVQHIVAGPSVYICDECVVLSGEVLAERIPSLVPVALAEARAARAKREVTVRAGLDAFNNLMARYKCVCRRDLTEPCIRCKLDAVARAFRGAL